LDNPSIQETGSNVVVRVDVTNVGTHDGTDVVQSYVKYPSAAGEPPEQLKAFARVTLSPQATRRIALTIPISNLSIFLHDTTKVFPGEYQVSVGQSSADLPISLPVKIPSQP
jgi:beta-glucosidase